MPASPIVSEEALIRILDSLNVGVVFIDQENRIAFVNKEAERIRRIQAEERVGKSILDCHQGAMHERVKEVIEGFKKGIHAQRHRTVKTFGRSFDNTYNVVTDDQGNYAGIALVSQDITEKLSLEEELKRTNEALEQKVKERTAEIEAAYRELQRAHQQLMHAEKMASIGQFVSGLAHEINNPLDGIQNCIRMVLMDCTDTEQTDRYLALALDGLFKIELIVRRLLDYARPHTLEKMPVDLNALLNQALTLTQFKLRNKNIVVHADFDQHLPPITGDPHFLQQVFVNIILNAFDAMKAGDTLTVTTRANGDGVSVEIADTGCGIPPSMLHRIFDPFFTTKMENAGTGLGLYLSYNVIHNHGGSISVDSIEGKGTTFAVWLPVALDRVEVQESVGAEQQAS
jgi:PAS domain S-box-containing protein